MSGRAIEHENDRYTDEIVFSDRWWAGKQHAGLSTTQTQPNL